MARASASKHTTRIQREKTRQIFDAALVVFSTYGYRGSTIDQIAIEAKMSKPNLLYYLNSKEDIHARLLQDLLDMWQKPLRQIDPDGQPIEEILAYAKRKLELSRKYPRQSRLFASEIFNGAQQIKSRVSGTLKELVDEKAALIGQWAAEGRIANVDAYHLIFSIWATTQHYADFDTQVRVLLKGTDRQRYKNAEKYLEHMFRTSLRPVLVKPT